jgi:hypothetical protein
MDNRDGKQKSEGPNPNNCPSRKNIRRNHHHPNWIYKRTIGSMTTEEGKEVEIQQVCRADITRMPYLDHFAKVKSVPRSNADEGKWVYVSSPYNLSSEEIEEMINEMKKHRVRFDISGESNYNPDKR